MSELRKKLGRHDKLLRLHARIGRQLDKLGVRDPLTANELRGRDTLLQKLFFIPTLRRIGVRANHISYLGILLVTAFNLLMFAGFHKLAFAAGGLGVLTDAVDGPTARWKDPETGRDDVTGWGTFLDHFRDYYFAFSFGWDAFFQFGRATSLEMVLASLVFLSYFLIFVAVLVKYQLLAMPDFLPFDETFSRAHIKTLIDRFSAFALAELQTGFWGRVQFLLLAMGVITLFLGKYIQVQFLIHLSYILLGGEAAIAFRNIIEEYVMKRREP